MARAKENAVDIAAILRSSPLIPVVVIRDARHAVRLGRALLAGGLPIVEVTLRTSAAMTAVRALRSELPEVLVGVGTVTAPAQFAQALQAGASFAVSPGMTPMLARAAREVGVPFLPGIATASEVMLAQEHGFDRLKFFPAEANGGVAVLKTFGELFPGVAFCPTGGITAESFREYLTLPNVPCVGGSWVAPADAIEAEEWTEISRRARAAVRAL